MDAVPAIPERLQLDADGRIAEDLYCLECEYNLRTLLPDAACPECGTPIGQSSRGRMLRFCDPAWLRRLTTGINWIAAGIALLLLGSILWIVMAKGIARSPK